MNDKVKILRNYNSALHFENTITNTLNERLLLDITNKILTIFEFSWN